jgi:hypothetical protein
MEAMLRISGYSYLYVKLAQMLCLSFYLLCFFFNKIGEERRTGYAYSKVGGEDERAGGERWSKQCIHI